MSKLERIQTFIQLIEENSFVGAAKKKKISTAAVSKQITQLENELNTELLHRTTRQIKPTEMGLLYYQECKKVVAGLIEIESMMSDPKEATGKLHVLSNPHFAMHYLIPQLPKFMALNPKLKIKFELGERHPNLVEEGIDILFGVGNASQEDLIQKKIAETRYVLCASPTYLKKHGTPKNPDDLVNHQYITHSNRPINNILLFKNGKKVFVKWMLELDKASAIRECAIRHMGIANLHDYSVADALKNKQLIEILPGQQEQATPIYLFYQRSRYLHPKIRRFIDFYTKEFADIF